MSVDWRGQQRVPASARLVRLDKLRHRLAVALAAVLVPVVAVAAWQEPTFAAKPKPRTLSAQQSKSIHTQPLQAKARPAQVTKTGPARQAHVTWPTGGSTTVTLAAGVRSDPGLRRLPADDRAATRIKAGALPVWVGTPSGGGATVGAANVTVLGRADTPAAWSNALLIRLSRTDGVAASGRASVTVDYSGFADAFGADYASRLRLVQIPERCLTTPSAAGCQATALPSTNDPSTKTVTADVLLAPTGSGVVTALEAGASGDSGTFGATSLSPSSSWTAGGNSGDFSFTYPIATPPGLGGPTPSVGLAYSSASVDGRNATTNNQPGWVGEGWDYDPGYIERSYKPCSDDEGSGANNTADSGDLCWGIDNANLSLSGHSGALIKDDATGTWRLQGDDNTKIEHVTGGVNGDNDGEYWKLTTSDGTQYFFGLNRLPGFTGTAPANKTTNSTWTEPVAGNNAGEPCHASGFTASFCAQAWRWNLDYVVDTHGNTMSVFYSTETNNYGRNNTPTDVQSYTRGGWVDHIDYGTDNRGGTDTENTATAAAMRVQFGVSDRCITTSCGTHDVTNWPDTPWDQSCTSATSCPTVLSPTFWLTKRLTTITTKVWDSAAGQYKDVDQWTLTHTFPPSGDGTRDGLWLASVTRTGKATGPAVVGSAITQPSMSFDWTQMANRVASPTDHDYAMNWMRLSTIWTDTGGEISIRYTPQECTPTNLPASPQTNTLRCYPVLEKQPDKSIKTEYFNKYLVDQVTQTDLTGGAPDVTTLYTYVGNPGWRHADDDGGMTQDNLRTWSDFRGYRQVNTQVGTPGQGAQSLTETVFFQGMDGDLNGSGGTTSVSLPAIDVNGDGDTTDPEDAPAVADSDAYVGLQRQSTVYAGVESGPVSTEVAQLWQSAPTASRNMGQTTVYARHTGTATTWTGTKLSGPGWRVTRTDTTFDSYGAPTRVDETGDTTVTGDEKCTTISYARNTTANLLDLTGEVDVYALSCAHQASPGPGSDADVISMDRTLYDHQAFGTTPTKGEQTETDAAKSWTTTAGPTWLTQSTSTYDSYGRPTDVTDVRGNHTTTAYTPATGPVTSVATTTLLGTTTDTVEPSWGATTATVDENGKRTEATYDALGRTSQVWQPNHTKASNPTQPSSTYTYLIRNSGGANAVTTNTLNAANAYTTKIELYDGWLRARQTQTVSLANGHQGTVFSDTRYDANGRAFQQSQYFDNSVQPSTDLRTIDSWAPYTQTVTLFDRADRPTAQITNNQGIEQWRTTTIYGGDRTSTIPPAGGVATTTITDVQGRTTQLRQYHNPTDVGSDNPVLYDVVTYHYNTKGQQDAWTDNAGNKWTATFDLLGRQTGSHDPDKGDSTATFNDAGDLLTSTTAAGTLAYTYDSLGRKTGEYTPTTSGTKLATWVWDPTGAKGQLASQSRWVGTNEYKIKTNGYTALYQPTSETYTIPASVTGLAGNYTFGHSYAVDGSLLTYSYANVGGLGGETLTYVYDTTDGLPDALQTSSPGLGTYVTNTDYNAYGEISFAQYQTTASAWVQRAYTYDDATHRLTRATTIRQTTPQAVDDTTYTYDPAGNITKQVQTSATSATDTQCFGYDYADRLTDAWTPTSGDCTVAPTTAGLGGPAPYWQSWTFDSAGDRTTQTDHATAGDTTATSTYPTPGPTAVRPHAVTSITTTGPGGTGTKNYSYDGVGNTTSRPGASGSQTLTWDVEDRLNSLVEGGTTTSYTYAPDGTRLIEADAANTTLYLPGEDLVRNSTTGTVTATRYYTWNNQTIATINSTSGGITTWLITDQQNTQQIAIVAGNQTITQRRQNPYGAPRGATTTWPTLRGFLGGANDQTGLVHEGAREYDAQLGRFVSVDPQFDGSDPQSWNAYSYGANNPVNKLDPSGESWWGAVKNYAKATVNNVKNDPIGFVEDVAIGIAVAATVTALCGTGVGCVIAAGIIAGAVVSATDYADEVSAGDHPFDGTDFVETIAIGAAIGGATAGVIEGAGGLVKAGLRAGAPRKLFWGSWQDYPKVTVNGRVYAKIGDWLYTRHAVDRMLPSGLGESGGGVGGRSVSPNFIDYVLRNKNTARVASQAKDGTPRTVNTLGSVRVITEGNVVVSVITLGTKSMKV